MTDKEIVLAIHPEAFVAPRKNDHWKIYRDRIAFVALSRSRATEAEAWADARQAIQERMRRHEQ